MANGSNDDLTQAFLQLFDVLDFLSKDKESEKYVKSYGRYKKLLSNNFKDINDRRNDLTRAWNSIKKKFVNDSTSDAWLKSPIIINMFAGKQSPIEVKIYCTSFYSHSQVISKGAREAINDALKYTESDSVDDVRDQLETNNSYALRVPDLLRYRLLDLFRQIEVDETNQCLITNELKVLKNTLDLTDAVTEVVGQNPLSQMFSNVGKSIAPDAMKNAPGKMPNIQEALTSSQFQDTLKQVMSSDGIGAFFSQMMGQMAQMSGGQNPFGGQQGPFNPGQQGGNFNPQNPFGGGPFNSPDQISNVPESAQAASSSEPDMSQAFNQFTQMAQNGGLGTLLTQMTSGFMPNQGPNQPSAEPTDASDMSNVEINREE